MKKMVLPVLLMLLAGSIQAQNVQVQSSDQLKAVREPFSDPAKGASAVEFAARPGSLACRPGQAATRAVGIPLN